MDHKEITLKTIENFGFPMINDLQANMHHGRYDQFFDPSADYHEEVEEDSVANEVADNNLDDYRSRYIGNPYLGHLVRYKQWRSMIQSNGDSHDVATMMDKGIEELAKKKAAEQKGIAYQPGSTVGLLQLDRRPRDKRIQPSQSPERRKTKKSYIKYNCFQDNRRHFIIALNDYESQCTSRHHLGEKHLLNHTFQFFLIVARVHTSAPQPLLGT